jgi:hypothetical protein
VVNLFFLEASSEFYREGAKYLTLKSGQGWPGFLTRNRSETMKLPDIPRRTTEVVTVVVSALRRRRPTEFSAVKIGQIRRYSRLLVENPG